MGKKLTRTTSAMQRRKMNGSFSSARQKSVLSRSASDKVQGNARKRQGIDSYSAYRMKRKLDEQKFVEDVVTNNLEKKQIEAGDTLTSSIKGKVTGKKLTINDVYDNPISGRMFNVTVWNGNRQGGQYSVCLTQGSSPKKTAELAKKGGITVEEVGGKNLTEIGAAFKKATINLYNSANSDEDQSEYKTNQETAIKNLSVGLTRSLDDAVGNSSSLDAGKMKDFVADTISQVVGENLSSDDKDLNECMKAYASDKPYAIIDKIMDTIPKVIHRQLTDKFQKDTEQDHVGAVKSALGDSITLSKLNSLGGIEVLSEQINNAPGMDVKSFLKAVFAEQSDVKMPDAILDKVAKACQDGQGESAIKDLMQSAQQVAELRGRISRDASNINPDQIEDWMSALDNSHKGKSPKQKQEILADFSAIFAKTIGMASQRQKELQTTLTQKKPSTAKAMISILHQDIENINQRVDKSRADIGNTARGLSIKGGRLQDNKFIEKLTPSTKDILKNIEIEGAGSHIWEPALEQVASALSDNLPSYMRFDAKKVVKNFISSHDVAGKDVEDVTKRFLDVLKQNLEIQTGSPEDVKIIERGTGWGKDLKKACENLNQGYCSQKDKDNFANICEGFVEDYKKSDQDNSLLEGMLRHLGFDNQGIEEKQQEISVSGDLKNTVSNIVRSALNKERSIVPYRGDVVSDYFTTAKFSDRAAKQDALKDVIRSGQHDVVSVTNELMNKVLGTEDADYNKALREELGDKFGSLIGEIFDKQESEDGLRLIRKIIRSATLLNSDKPEVQEQGEKKFEKLCNELRNNGQEGALDSVKGLLSSIVTAQYMAKDDSKDGVIASESKTAGELAGLCDTHGEKILNSLNAEDGASSLQDAMKEMRTQVDAKKAESRQAYDQAVGDFDGVKLDSKTPTSLDVASFNDNDACKKLLKDDESFNGIIADSQGKQFTSSEWFNIMMSMAGDDKVKEAAPRYAMKSLTNVLAKQFVESWDDIKNGTTQQKEDAQEKIKTLTQKVKDIISVGDNKKEWQHNFMSSLRDALAVSMREDTDLDVSQEAMGHVRLDSKHIQHMLSQAKSVHDNAPDISDNNSDLSIDIEDENASATLADKIMNVVLSRENTDEEVGDLNKLISQCREQCIGDDGNTDKKKFEEFLNDVGNVWASQFGGFAKLPNDLAGEDDEKIVSELKKLAVGHQNTLVKAFKEGSDLALNEQREGVGGFVARVTDFGGIINGAKRDDVLKNLMADEKTKHLADSVMQDMVREVYQKIRKQKPQRGKVVDISGEVNNVSKILAVAHQANPEAATEYAQQALTSIADTPLSRRYPQFKEAMAGVVEEFMQDIKGDGQEKAPLSGAAAFDKAMDRLKDVGGLTVKLKK